MKRNFLIPLVGLSLFYTACRSPEVLPEPEEYFSFYADGVFYDYPQVMGWGGSTRTIEAEKTGTTSYRISALLDDPPIGLVSMSIPGAHIPDQDTIALTSAGIMHFNEQGNNYEIYPPLKGRIIFTERTQSKLTGTFEFEAFRIINDDEGNRTITDTILKVTNGNFSIKPKA